MEQLKERGAEERTARAVGVRPLPGGYPLVQGPFTHLAAERDRLVALRWRHFDARMVGTTLGAEISGITISQPLGKEVVAELRQALADYKVLFFRDQPMSSAQHVAFARQFGELEFHPLIPPNEENPELARFEKENQISGEENLWHHDVTFRAQPSLGAVLRAVTVPAIGGDTLFSDMYAAYEGLDDETKKAIEGRDAVHDSMQSFGQFLVGEQRDQMRASYPPVRHPLVCTHAETGRRHLYVNRAFVDRIDGMDPDGSRDLIDRLCRQADYPEHQVRLKWEPNTVAFWDNRAVQHYAASDYWPQVRVMERASIIGPRPTR